MSDIDKKWLKVMAFVTPWVILYCIAICLFAPGWLAVLNFLTLFAMLVVMGRELL